VNPAAHRRDEGHLVTVSNGLLPARVVLVPGRPDEPQVRLQRRQRVPVELVDLLAFERALAHGRVAPLLWQQWMYSLALYAMFGVFSLF